MAHSFRRRDLLIGSVPAGIIGNQKLFPLLGSQPPKREAIEPLQEDQRGKRFEADVVVVGGGMSGVCAALAAARNGAETVLVQDRSVLGGNSSSEIRMHVSGAVGGGHKNAREGGILEELILENQARNAQRSATMWDLILWEAVHLQPGLTLLLNTVMTSCRVEGGRILSIRCRQTRTEEWLTIEGRYFVDATGNGTLGSMAGNPFMTGQEAKREYGESLAPEEATPFTLGSSLLFQARDLGSPTPFIPAKWAYSFPTDEDLLRGHDRLEYGYWWIEWGGTLDTIKDDDRIQEELLKILFGVWDHIKNRGDHGAENWALDWFGFLPGRRESRRLKGSYILRETDLTGARVFPDQVAYGGWAIDHHFPKGFHHRDKKFWHPERLKSPYSIPLRSLFSATLRNLFIGGRALSATHLAFCSTRVMATCAVIGQGIGTAAAYCSRKSLSPEELSPSDLSQIQQVLLKQDAYLMEVSNSEPDDFARKAVVRAGSQQPGYEAERVIDGVGRTVGNNSHQWRSTSLGPDQSWLELDFGRTVACREVHLSFDSNYSRRLRLSHDLSKVDQMIVGPPPELVRDYDLEGFIDGSYKVIREVRGNYQRKNIQLLDGLKCSRIRIRPTASQGVPEARIFEVRCY